MMTIGGNDHVLDVFDGPTALEVAVQCASAVWPSRVFDQDAIGRTADAGRLTFRPVDEVIVFRDAIAARSWDELGADPSNADGMVYLLCDSDRLTVVTGDGPTPDADRILAAIRSARIDGRPLATTPLAQGRLADS